MIGAQVGQLHFNLDILSTPNAPVLARLFVDPSQSGFYPIAPQMFVPVNSGMRCAQRPR
jgi:hypothetical protein